MSEIINTESIEDLELKRLVNQAIWTLPLYLICLVLFLTALFMEQPGLTRVLFLLSMIPWFYLIKIIGPDTEHFSEKLEKNVYSLAVDRILGKLKTAAVTIIVWSLIIFAYNKLDWAQERLYEFAEDISEFYKISQEFILGNPEKDSQAAIDALEYKGISRQRLEIETELANKLSEDIESREVKSKAMTALSNAATTASRINDIDALEKLIKKQIEVSNTSVKD